MDDSDQSLRGLFSVAREKQQLLETQLDPSAPEYAETLRLAIRNFEECLRMLAHLSIFSSNESLDEVATADLQYLASEYYLAQLLTRSSATNRRQVLLRVCELYDRFLERLRDYSLISSPDRKLFERFKRDPASFSFAEPGDAAGRRSIKIARLQEERTIKAKLQALRDRSSEHNVDDEVLREIYLADVELCANKSFAELDLLSQELEMLKSASTNTPDSRDDERSHRQAPQDSYSDRLDRPPRELLRGSGGPILDPKGRPLQPFTITDKRDRIRKGIFKPGHNLPTMSIDEYLEEERKRGGILDGESKAESTIYDEDDVKQADEETMKTRAWDEFTESNSRGSGNTLNRG
ncbi:MAG: hypothetical protein Q9160_000605 [Pyrenula sp. 1 TL-2023]